MTVRLVLTYFIVFILTLSLIGYYIIVTTNNFFISEEKMNASKIANIVSSFAPDYIVEDNSGVSEEFSPFLKSILPDDKMRVIITNKDSIAIYDSHHNEAILGKAQVKETVITALGGEEGVENYKATSTEADVIDVAVPITTREGIAGAVNIIYTVESVQLFTSAMRESFVFIVCVSSLLIGLVIFVMVNFMTRRIINFTDKITLMSDGVLDEKMEIKGNDEIARMGVAFNTMAEKLALNERRRIQFVSDASHELKTPLSSIKLMADSILQNPDIPREQTREFLTDINNEADRLNRIINRLLSITRLDTQAEGGEYKTEPVNLAEFIEDIIKTLRPLAAKSDVTLKLEGEKDVFFLADKDSLFQAIYNICDNAIKYTNPEGEINIFLEKSAENAIIRIRDNGVGMSAEDTEHIFERFYRVDKARSRETGGTGLGLAIANAAVKAHGGHIEVISELNMGSEFIIVLPLKSVHN